ncbi:MAG: YciI family protein [Thermomicrobiales bacterium]
MKYMLLIYGGPADGPAQDSPEGQAEFGQWFQYYEQITGAGVQLDGAALQPTATAPTVRVRADERVLSDGPFAETKEVLGSYYVVDVPDLDAAIDWAGRMPHIGHGSVEVRPVMELPAG